MSLITLHDTQLICESFGRKGKYRDDLYMLGYFDIQTVQLPNWRALVEWRTEFENNTKLLLSMVDKLESSNNSLRNILYKRESIWMYNNLHFVCTESDSRTLNLLTSIIEVLKLIQSGTIKIENDEWYKQ